MRTWKGSGVSRQINLDEYTRENMHYPVNIMEWSTLRNLVNPVREEFVRGYIDERYAISGDTLARARHEA